MMLKVLQQIIEEVNIAESIYAALDLVVERVVNELDTQACSILLYDDAKEEFVLLATCGLLADAVGKVSIPLGQGLVSMVADRGEPLRVVDANQHENYYQIPGSGEQRYNTFLGAPIQFRRKNLGVLVVEHGGEREYDESEEAFLLTLATQLAVVIAQAEAKGTISFTLKGAKGLPDELRGIPSASGVAVGQAVVVYQKADLNVVPIQITQDVAGELELFQSALEQTRNEVRVLAKRLAKDLAEEEQALFDAYLKMLEGDTLVQAVSDAISANKLTAQSAVARVFLEQIRLFRTMDNQYLQERAQDIDDLGRRLLSNLQDDEDEQSIEYPDRVVLIGDEVMPTNLAEIPHEKLVAVVSGSGSVNSHVAILARALGVPSIMGVSELPLTKLNSITMIVDGYLGQVHIDPSASVLQEFETLAGEEQALDKELEELRELPATTSDGHNVSLFVNAGLAADIGKSITAGAEGIGLYRTEVPFMTRDRFPSSEEQRVIYRQLLGVFAPKPVIIRSLDIGGDKSLPYFPIKEENPFLGWRGIRVLLEQPEIFLSQIRAMLRASEGYKNLHIMLPMITDISEVEEAMRLIKRTHKELVDDGADIEFPKIGIMVEVPSVVYEVRNFARIVDFLSVGSNDLTQYLLAVDRNNPRVAGLYDSLHPAVLKAMKQVVEGAHAEGKSVSICGEMAADPMSTLVLLGMGFDMLSASAPTLLRVKWVIRKFTIKQARKILSEVLTMRTAGEVRRHLEFVLEEQGMGGLIRAGRH